MSVNYNNREREREREREIISENNGAHTCVIVHMCVIRYVVIASFRKRSMRRSERMSLIKHVTTVETTTRDDTKWTIQDGQRNQ